MRSTQTDGITMPDFGPLGGGGHLWPLAVAALPRDDRRPRARLHQFRRASPEQLPRGCLDYLMYSSGRLRPILVLYELTSDEEVTLEVKGVLPSSRVLCFPSASRPQRPAQPPCR